MSTKIITYLRKMSKLQTPEQARGILGGRVVEVTGDRVSIVTDMAVRAENIDEAKVKEARQHDAARLRGKISDEKAASVNASLVRSLVQLRVKGRRHT